MTTLLITIHVLSVILTIGPVTAAASMFPATARTAHRDPGASLGQLVMLHRICRTYSAVALAVPAFGVASAARQQVWGQAWLMTAIALTAVAAAVLIGLVLPDQRHLLAELGTTPAGSARTAASRNAAAVGSAHAVPGLPRRGTSRLAAATGGFNLLWVTVAVLMLAKPGAPAGS